MSVPPSRRRRPAPLLARLHVRLLAAALLVAVALPAGAQYFGRNKVLWEDFPFRKAETEHFDLYYYPADHAAAGDLARMAERWHDRLTAAMDHRLADRKPLIFYASARVEADAAGCRVPRGDQGAGAGAYP